MPKAKIVNSEDLSATAKLFTLEVLSRGFSFLPGQYINFFPINRSNKRAIRSYSICSVPDDLPRIELGVRQVKGGLGTEFLKASVGKIVAISQAEGDFLLPEKPKEVIFIAAGIGITPIRSQIRTFLPRQTSRRMQLIYRFRDRKEFLFEEEFRQFADEYKNFHFIAVMSVAFDYKKSLQTGLKMNPQQIVQVAGPPAFVGETLQILEKLGYNKQVIRTDEWE